MTRSPAASTIARALISIVLVSSMSSGCKKKSDESEEPIQVPEKKKTEASADATASAAPSASAAPASSASASAAPADSAAPATSGSAAAAPTTAPSAATPSTPEPANTGAAGAGNAQGIDKCCAALGAIQTSGVSKETKLKAAAASATCGGISKLVKTGKTSRASALAQLRAALSGATPPAACN